MTTDGGGSARLGNGSHWLASSHRTTSQIGGNAQMGTCAGITREGQRCTLSADPSSGMCWLHDPARAGERRRHASKAARSKGNKEVASLKEEIKGVITDVKAGELDRNDAAVMIQGYRALKDFIALERQVKETDELAAEIEEMREILRARKEKSWAG